MIATLVIALSVHVIMLQNLHVPYPHPSAEPPWIGFAKAVLAVGAVAGFYRLARPSLPSSMVAQVLIVFALDAGLKESVRLAIMSGLTTTAYAYSLLHALNGAMILLIRDLLVVALASFIKHSEILVPALVAIAAFVNFVLQPTIAHIFSTLSDALHLVEHAEVYTEPYGLGIEIPAYLTFAEPVVACMIMAVLVWPRLGGRSVPAFVRRFAILILLVRGTLAFMLLDSFLLPQPLWLASLSTGQFCFEPLTLAVLTALVWLRCNGRSRTVSTGA
jgi:hypothetical protein